MSVSDMLMAPVIGTQSQPEQAPSMNSIFIHVGFLRNRQSLQNSQWFVGFTFSNQLSALTASLLSFWYFNSQLTLAFYMLEPHLEWIAILSPVWRLVDTILVCTMMLDSIKVLDLNYIFIPDFLHMFLLELFLLGPVHFVPLVNQIMAQPVESLIPRLVQVVCMFSVSNLWLVLTFGRIHSWKCSSC